MQVTHTHTHTHDNNNNNNNNNNNVNTHTHTYTHTHTHTNTFIVVIYRRRGNFRGRNISWVKFSCDLIFVVEGPANTNVHVY